MNCFNHPDKVAVGVCRSCGKGLCRECIAETDEILACASSETCKRRASSNAKIVDNYPSILSGNRLNMGISALVMLIAGAVFGLVAIRFFFKADVVGGFIFLVPTVLALFFGINQIRCRRKLGNIMK